MFYFRKKANIFLISINAKIFRDDNDNIDNIEYLNIRIF